MKCSVFIWALLVAVAAAADSPNQQVPSTPALTPAGASPTTGKSTVTQAPTTKPTPPDAPKPAGGVGGGGTSQTPTTKPTTPSAPAAGGSKAPSPPATTPCTIPGWNKPTPAPSTPCVIPGWNQAAPPATTPCVLPGWNNGGCTEVSVEGDATYCITGPVCSGDGETPAGTNCPKQSAVAVKDCLQNLTSYQDAGKCVAPMDATCAKIKTGAWGCVFGAASTPCPLPGWNAPSLNSTDAKQLSAGVGGTDGAAGAPLIFAAAGVVGAIALVALVAVRRKRRNLDKAEPADGANRGRPEPTPVVI